MKTRINHFFLFLLCVLFFSHSDVCVAVDWTSNKWNNGVTSGKIDRRITVSSNETVTIKQNIHFQAQITVKTGCTLTIIGGTGYNHPETNNKYALWNKLPDTDNTNAVNNNDSCFCMFYVEPGAKLVLKNIDVNGNAHNDYASGIANGHFTQADKFRFGSDGSTEYRPLIYGGIYSCGELELVDCRIHDFNCKTADTPEKRKQRTNYSAITISHVPLKSSSQSTNTKGLTTTITGCEIFDNISYTGSALFTHTCDKAEFNRINITNSNIYHNVTRVLPDAAWGDAFPNKWGGAIRTQGNSNAELNLKNVKIYENLANGECAGIFFNAKLITFDGCEIYKNESQICGGGLRIETNCEFNNTLGKKTIVRDNTAATYGGGIHFYGYESTAYPTTQNWVYNLNDNLEVTGNKAKTGAGIAFEFSEKMQIGDNSKITANINGGIINGNIASENGGGIYAKNSTNPAKNYTITINLNDGDIGASGVPNKAVNGAGIYIDGMAISSTNESGSTNLIEVAYNEASQNGGGIYSNNGDVTLQGNLKVHNNKASGGSFPCGGGIYCGGGKLTVNNADVTANSAQDGAGVYANNGAVLNLKIGKINSNTATGWGAGIRAEGNSTVNLENGEISSNTCNWKAGGVYLANSTMNITGSAIISLNKSLNQDGAGVYAQNSEFTMNNGTISGNEAANSGAGIFAQNSTVTVNNGTISGNTANISGGGIYFVLTEAVEKTLKFGGGEIKNNHATTGSGGGVYISGFLSGGVVTPANFIMNAGTVSGNEAPRVATDEELTNDYSAAVKLGAGGGIYIQEGHATLGVADSSEKCEISGNTCGQYGGGIYMTSSVGTGTFSSTLTMNNGVVDSNTAGKRGGGIYMKQSVLTMNGGNVTRNTATTGHAGGIDLNNTVFTMTGGNVSWNKAAKRGGGIYYNNVADTGLGDDWKDRDFIFSGGTISHNSAGVDYTNNPGEYDAAKEGEYGGGVCIYTGANGDTNGSKLELSGGTIEYNYAANGGGVYYNGWGCTTLTIENTNIENNTSFIGGGLLAYHGAITYTSGRIRFNKAKLRPGQTENLTGFTMNHINHCTWDGSDDKVKTDLSGLGGGIFGNSVNLTISGKTFGLYSNLADVAADDLLMNGGVDDFSSTINLPKISDMTIDGFDVPIASLFWAQDYIKGDTGYGNRPVEYTNNVSVDRFRTKLYNIATDIGYIESGKTNNYYRDYICATLGYKLLEVTLNKSGLKPGESAIINLYRKNDVQQSDKPQYQVVLTGNAEGTTVSRKVYLQPGAWTVLESDWSWAYNASVAENTPDAATVLGRPAIIRTLIDDKSNRVFSFVNAPKENTPPHAEDLKPNEIH